MGIKIKPIHPEESLPTWELHLKFKALLAMKSLDEQKAINRYIDEEKKKVELTESRTKLTYYHYGEETFLYEKQNSLQ